MRRGLAERRRDLGSALRRAGVEGRPMCVTFSPELLPPGRAPLADLHRLLWRQRLDELWSPDELEAIEKSATAAARRAGEEEGGGHWA